MTSACASIRRAQPLLGTFVEVAATGAPSSVGRAVEAAFETIAQVHRLMSVHLPGSDMARLNGGAGSGSGPLAVHPWTYAVLEAALDLHRRSDGAFDIVVAPALVEKRRPRPRPEAEAPAPVPRRRSAAIELLSGHRVRFLDRDVRIDLGGIAKGFAVDRALEVLERHGMSRALVNAGGDLALFGTDAEAIHIRDPRAPSRLLCQIAVERGALASTGRRFDPSRASRTGELTVIDPARQRPARGIAGASVRASTAMIADALTKLVAIDGQGSIGLLDHYGASALLVRRDGSVHVTSGWPEAARRAD